eukprot:TRINITY_DN20935_c0_g1_i1.p1 TRINITY_DN20935_c0_g1~~TRINITY_DN20935_c0_g1_i1.p1  ORF type:complete len:752 (+),score=262.50 TRINITY_DN20935_c0_g1_i1:73-2256(+)
MAGLPLRGNLIAAWTEGSFIYCKPGGIDERDSLWVVVDGAVEDPAELVLEDNAWMDDAVVELAVSCGGTYLMIRGVATCYVATLPAAPQLLDAALPCLFLYEDVQAADAHFHTTCDSVLYTLVDHHTVCVYCCVSAELLGVIPLHSYTPSDGLVLSMSPVYNTHGPSAFYFFTGSISGTVELFAPIVIPGVQMPNSTLTGLDPVLDNEVRNKIAGTAEDGSGFATIPPSHLPAGTIHAPYQRTVGDVGDAVLALRAEETDGVVTVVAVTAAKAVVFTVDLDTARVEGDDDAREDDDEATASQPVGVQVASFPFATAPQQLDLNLDRYRYFCSAPRGSAQKKKRPCLIAVAHAGGLAVVNTQTAQVAEVAQAAAPLLHRDAGGAGTAGQVLLGVALYRDAHPDLMSASLYAPSGTCHGIAGSELVVDYIEEALVAGGSAKGSSAPAILPSPPRGGASTPGGAALPAALVRWSEQGGADAAGVPAEKRRELLQAVNAVSHRLGPEGAEGIGAQLAAHAHCRAVFADVLAGMAAAVQAKEKELQRLQKAHRAAVQELEEVHTVRCAALDSRLARLREAARSGKHSVPRHLAAAVSDAIAPHAHLLPRHCVTQSVGEFRAHLAAAGIAPSPALEARCGAECSVLRAADDAPAVSVVAFADGTTAHLATATLEPLEPTKLDHWNDAIDLATERDNKCLGDAERDARTATASLRYVNVEFHAALKAEAAEGRR